MKKCYYCGDNATSKEHVPPKCIFPEKKDLPGEYRKNLITVPSCDIHNSQKSNNDEFQMVCLAGIFGNNSIGFQHKLTKVDRAIVNSSGKLLEQAFLDKQKYYIKSKNFFFEVIWGTPDHERLIECFRLNSFALYRYHFRKRFIGEIKTFLGYPHYKDENNETWKKFFKHKISIELAGKKINGENPDIFCYQFTEPDELGLITLKMCFYGGIEIYSALIPEKTSIPQRLDTMLLNEGIQTTIVLEDQEYTFNKK